jgi:hypothetical protein
LSSSSPSPPPPPSSSPSPPHPPQTRSHSLTLTKRSTIELCDSGLAGRPRRALHRWGLLLSPNSIPPCPRPTLLLRVSQAHARAHLGKKDGSGGRGQRRSDAPRSTSLNCANRLLMPRPAG